MADDPDIPLVSAIVLSFNRKEETLRCLACLQAQTYPRLEVIVTDNGSVDGSADAIADQFPQFTLRRLPGNLGAWAPRHSAIAEATGEFVFMVDNDTEFGPGVIAALVARMQAEPELGVVQPRIIGGEGRSPAPEAAASTPSQDAESYRYQFHGCAALLRRDAYTAAGGFPPHYFVAGGEGYLSSPLVEAGYRILYFPAVSVTHAYSPKGRVRRQRFLMSNLHRMQNVATFNPFITRVLLDFVWKCGYFAIGCLRRRYFLLLPGGLWLHLRGFLTSLCAHRRPVSRETQRCLDFLAIHRVRTASEYETIDATRSGFWALLRHRLRSDVHSVREP